MMISQIKRQSPFTISLIMLVFIASIMLLPIDGILQSLSLSDFQIEYAGLAIKMSIILIISYSLITILNVKVVAGLSTAHRWKFWYLNIIPVYLFILGLTSVVGKDLSQIQLSNLLLLACACLLVGFAEEFMFRGLLQSLFLKKYVSRKNGIFLSVLIVALIFGSFHLINLVKNDNVMQVLVQVVYAIFIGFFFGVMVLKTNKIIPIAITHGLINFFFSLSTLPGLAPVENDANNAISIAPIIIMLPLLIVGMIVIRKVKAEDVNEKLQAITN